MWVFMSNAYLSIVEDKDDYHDLWVRARLPGDLERVFPDAPVTETPNADYRFRAKLERSEVERAMQLAVSRINYTNFKNSVKDLPRYNAYLRVWSVMEHEQEMQRIDEQARNSWPQVEPPSQLPFDSSARCPRIPVKLPPTTVRQKINRRGKKAARPRPKNR